MTLFTKARLAGLLAIAMWLGVNNVYAMACYEKSPHLVAQQDRYFTQDSYVVLSDDDKAVLNNLFNKLNGKWEGDSTHTVCSGPDSAPRQETQHATVNAEVSAGTNVSISMLAEINYTEDKIARHQSINLSGNAGFYQLKIIGTDHVTISEKYRRSNINASSRLIETIFDIALEGDSFMMTISYYTNGVLTGVDRWSLHQR